jgi:peptidoglycan/LPS O-acetylase OafA/YrhL
MNKWPKHLYALDVSRGLAALSVVLWHWQHFQYTRNTLSLEFIKENQPLHEILRLFYQAGAMGVQYFFLLSGFVFFWLYGATINNNKISAWKFGVQRFSRLYPLHFLTLLVVALLQAIYFSRENVSFIYPFNDMYHFTLNLFYASRWGFESGPSFNASIWSVSVEVLLYLIFFISITLRQGGWLYCLSISFVSLILSRLTDNVVLGGLSLFFLGGTVFYLTQIISFKYEKLKSPIYVLTILFWCGVIVDIYIYNISSSIMDLGVLGKVILRGFTFYILFPFTICTLVLIEIDKGDFLKPISWIGDISYSSYLLHFPLQLLFGLAVSYGVLNHNFYLSPIYLVLYFLILIPISYVTFHAFERPVQIILRNKLLLQKEV